MSKYGKAAVEAVKSYTNGAAASPQDAWESATAKHFGLGTPSQQKGCPRNTFLGLCEAGLVAGVEPGSYTQSKKNKQYAVDAVAILKQRPSLLDDPKGLWATVLQGEPKKHNQQMDVVIALWKDGLIRTG